MRPLFIDFLADSPRAEGNKAVRWVLSSLVLLLLVAEGFFLHKWQGDNERLRREFDAIEREASRASAGQTSSIEAPDQLRIAQASASVSLFDPIFLNGVEQAVKKVRDAAPDARLRINGLGFDARQRKIELQGESLQHRAVNQLRDEILLLLPQSAVSFPSLSNSAAEGRPLQFEIAIRLSPATGSDL